MSPTFQALMMTAAGGATSNTYVTGQTLSGTLRNDGGGYWSGFKFTMGGAGISVTHVGRWKAASDSNLHDVQLFSYSGITPSPIAGANVSVDMSQSPAADGYVYAALASPVSLSASANYSIGSQETNGVDHFYQNDTTITTTAVATAAQGFYYLNSGVFGTTLGAGTTYGPVSFKYT